MGTIVRGKCPECGYRAEILTGGGLRDCEPKTALSAARGDPGLEAALINHGQFRIERFSAVCGACRRILAAAQVTYWTPDGAEHTVPAACPGCGGSVKRYDGEMPCPVCGHSLDLMPVGHWD